MTSKDLQDLQYTITQLTFDLSEMRKRLAVAENVVEILIEEINALNDGIATGDFNHERDAL